MRISAQNNQFIFNFPVDLIEKELNNQFSKLIEKNFIPYDNVLDYLNSTIKEIVFNGINYDVHTQRLRRGKEIAWKDSKSVFDTFTNEVDITFRAVDSYLNYFILMQILTEFYLNVQKHQIENFQLKLLDYDGTLLYTVDFDEVLLKSISEIRLGYQQYSVSEKTFTVTFRYNFIDIRWQIDGEDKSIFDIPINVKKGKLDDTDIPIIYI